LTLMVSLEYLQEGLLLLPAELPQRFSAGLQ